MATAHRRVELARSGLVVAILLWAGVVIGVSFLAAPAKFMAPHLSLPVAMEIGQREFHTLNVVETGLALAALALAALARPGRTIWLGLGLGLAAVLVVAQGLWLLPVLDARAEMIIDGGTPPDAPWHAVYVVAEVLKLVVLLVTGWLALRWLRSG